MKKYNLINLKNREIYGDVILENENRLIKIKVRGEHIGVIKRIIDETNKKSFLKAKIDDDLVINDASGNFWLALKQNLIRYLDIVTKIAD